MTVSVKSMRRAVLMLCLLLFLPAPGGAQEERLRPGPMMHRMMEDWTRRLNLSAEQRARIKELREAYLRDTLPWRNNLVVKRFDLRNMMCLPKPDPDQVLLRQREISELQARIQERFIRHQLEMRQVLTPEQIRLLPPAGERSLRMMPGPMPGRGRE